MGSNNIETIRALNHFDAQVPHWFLSPWFPQMTKPDIYRHSQNLENDCLYAVHEKMIQMNLSWVNYLLENAALLKAFCYWNLAIFLQKKNPNVPDIPNKIIKLALRPSLTNQRTGFWNIVFEECGSLKCIYTEELLTKENFAVEHFIPYNFVSHNLMWNLVPADKSFNCKKSDKLPSMSKHFDAFFSLQQIAIGIVRDKQPRNKFLEDYLTLFSDIGEINQLDDSFTKERFRKRIEPLISIASNNGFEFLK
ncbi:MAG: HNH endonuclease domain-containing protein [Ferruginibacter sp.]